MTNEPYSSADYWNGVVAEIDALPNLPTCPTPRCTLAVGPSGHSGQHMDFHGVLFDDENGTGQ